MAQSSSPVPRGGAPVGANPQPSSASPVVLAPTDAKELRLQQLRNTNFPPVDHAYFELPAESIHETEHARAYSGRGVSLGRGPEPGTLSRAVVQNFLTDGLCPENAHVFKALALYLLSNKLFNALTWLLVHSGTTYFDLTNCSLGNEGIANVAQWAETLPLKINLMLWDNGIEAKGAALLAESLGTNAYLELDLMFNPLGDDGVQSICAAMKQNSTLKRLCLTNVGAGSSSIEALAALIDSHPALSSLIINGINFDDESAAVFSAALGHNKSLDVLQMRGVQASDAGLCLVADALKTNMVLTHFELSRRKPSDIPAALAYSLAKSLVVNKTLAILGVAAEDITIAAANTLMAGVARNTTVKHFISPFRFLSRVAAVENQIQDKVRANALIGLAGLALSDLSQLPESAVSVPPEVGQSIAGFVAQVAADFLRTAAMKSIAGAGPVGYEEDAEYKQQ